MTQQCVQCRELPVVLGVLCRRCARDLAPDPEVVPEQISAQIDADPTFALVDAWGRAHRGADGMIIGRHEASRALVIWSRSISRQHARISRERDSFIVRDLGSTNGTFADGVRVVDTCSIKNHSTLRFGRVSFYFLIGRAPSAEVPAGSVQTRQQGPLEDFEADEPTVVGDAPSKHSPTPPRVEVVESSAGGGGLITVAGSSARLTAPQLALARVLLDRFYEDSDKPVELRGFVSSGEIQASVPWDTAHPNDAHVKQLVRRVRKTLERSSLSIGIESRQGMGYRFSLTLT